MRVYVSANSFRKAERERKKFGRKKQTAKGKQRKHDPHVVLQDTGKPPKYSLGRPSKYTPEVHNLIAAFMARDGWTVNQMCEELGIVSSTFYHWMSAYPDFARAINNGRDYTDKLVENALLKSALGFVEEWDETTYEYEDGDGEMLLPSKKKTVHKRQVFKPDVSAIRFWLINRKVTKWRTEDYKLVHGGKVEVEVKPDLSILSMEELKQLESITAKIPGKEEKTK